MATLMDVRTEEFDDRDRNANPGEDPHPGTDDPADAPPLSRHLMPPTEGARRRADQTRTTTGSLAGAYDTLRRSPLLNQLLVVLHYSRFPLTGSELARRVNTFPSAVRRTLRQAEGLYVEQLPPGEWVILDPGQAKAREYLWALEHLALDSTNRLGVRWTKEARENGDFQ